ncbi:MAG: hypothetical protein A2X77_03975 [Gammaproteobacteria bacterium GWE2_42_36]|nr:MAG: hypothetical protein A2X77_03975 [Gammaproteobacteria bacterium GWE2_42_36]HCU04995.1 phosphohydrolase [Coxiellaceae bacterium]
MGALFTRWNESEDRELFAENILIPQSELIVALSRAVDLVSSRLIDHQKRVAYIAYRIAKANGLNRAEQLEILLAGLLHDIGATPLALQQRSQILDFNYDDSTRCHQEASHFILKDYEPFKQIADIARYHHANWQKDRDTVHSFCHYINLADKIDTLLHPDSYVLHQVDEIKERIVQERGKKFNPEFVDVFLSLVPQESFWLDIVSSYLDGLLTKEIETLQKAEFDLPNLLSFANMVSKVIDFRSPFTATHSVGVAYTAKTLAEYMGFSEQQCTFMQIAGLFHDIGKLVVPHEILNKPDKLTIDEMKIMKTHTFHTYRIMSKITGFHEITEWAAFHHERLDGKGYPFRIAGNEISLEARIMAVADIFTALREERPYKPGFDKQKILSILNNMIGEAIDERVVSVLTDNFQIIEEICLQQQHSRDKKYKEMQNFIQ